METIFTLPFLIMTDSLVSYNVNIPFRGTATISIEDQPGLSRQELISNLKKMILDDPFMLLRADVCTPESWMFEDSWDCAVSNDDFLVFDDEWIEIEI